VLAFSPAGIGAALTISGLVYAVVQFPGRTYSDSLSRATLILPGFVVLIGSFVAIGLSVTAVIFVGAARPEHLQTRGSRFDPPEYIVWEQRSDSRHAGASRVTRTTGN